MTLSCTNFLLLLAIWPQSFEMMFSCLKNLTAYSSPAWSPTLFPLEQVLGRVGLTAYVILPLSLKFIPIKTHFHQLSKTVLINAINSAICSYGARSDSQSSVLTFYQVSLVTEPLAHWSLLKLLGCYQLFLLTLGYSQVLFFDILCFSDYANLIATHSASELKNKLYGDNIQIYSIRPYLLPKLQILTSTAYFLSFLRCH